MDMCLSVSLTSLWTHLSNCGFLCLFVCVCVCVCTRVCASVLRGYLCRLMWKMMLVDVCLCQFKQVLLCVFVCVCDGPISWSGRRMVLDQALIIQSGACSDLIGREAGSMIWLKRHYGHVQSTLCLGVDSCMHTYTQNKPACLDTDRANTTHKHRHDGY